ncbi:uncharacterized protein DDB_G0283697-like [Atheta coriaria]|uniref:uncharacterized protein DDB_G0283697-like n=1 Tax=Dalotia coriaria TaxID=877792 RepID=UPI0031F41225
MQKALTILALTACVAASFDDDIFAGNDPKDNYFRYVRTYSQADYDDGQQSAGEDAPKPYGFDIYYPKHSKRNLRVRRDESTVQKKELDESEESDDTQPEIVIHTADDKLLNIDEALKPLELDVLEADVENATDSVDAEVQNGQNHLIINDFIRFKRDAQPNPPNQERSGKMLLSDGQVLDTNREPRGVVQEKWVKQPYPVQGDNRNFDEASNEHGQPPNAPRVHFVTQRRSESAPPLVYHSYESRDREGRSRDITRQRDIDLERDFQPTYYPRSTRQYNLQPGGGRDYGNRDPGPAAIPRRPEVYYRNYERDSRDRDLRDFRDDRDYNRDFDRDRHRDFRDRRFYNQPDRFYEEDRPIPSIAKQKRIIYYATLPDIIRPPGGERGGSRDRDRDRDSSFRRGYDDRDRDRDRDRDNRVNTDDRPANAINYRFRNESPYDNRDATADRDKSRYDEAATAKSNSYPTKVSSADVSVRALTKNPERRVYSEVGRRYPPGYHRDDGPAAYESNHR